MPARALMVQGTASYVGKSMLVAALCRIFREDGYAVAPFKAQNMALNSFVTRAGGEIGRAQAVQAQAARVEPTVDMNPVLLKPVAGEAAQVVIHGKVAGSLAAGGSARDYVKRAWPAIVSSFGRLAAEFEILVLEGAGSPAEVNLRAGDLANMRVARLARAPVILVADIDKGGALAAVVGTLALLPPEERKQVAGIVLNKFRGKKELFRSALEFLEEKTGLPVLGVIPYFSFRLPEEDLLEPGTAAPKEARALEVAVLRFPHLANFTDFDALALEPDVNLRYVLPGERIGRPDLLVLPGSKFTQGDLLHLRTCGWEEEIFSLVAAGVPVVGICGGYQMLGEEILDPEGVEARGGLEGLGLLAVKTLFRPRKVTRQVRGKVVGEGILAACRGEEVWGYEVHMGESRRAPGTSPAFLLSRGEEEVLDGAVSKDGLVFGTYLHGLFDADGFRRAFLNTLRQRKGWEPLSCGQAFSSSQEKKFKALAALVRAHLNLPYVYKLLGLPGPRRA